MRQKRKSIYNLLVGDIFFFFTFARNVTNVTCATKSLQKVNNQKLSCCKSQKEAATHRCS